MFLHLFLFDKNIFTSPRLSSFACLVPVFSLMVQQMRTCLANSFSFDMAKDNAEQSVGAALANKQNYFSACINYEQEKCIPSPGTIHKDSTRCMCKVCWGKLDGRGSCLRASTQETLPCCRPRMAAVQPETWESVWKVWASSSLYRPGWALLTPKLCKQIHNLCICSAAQLYTEVHKFITGTKSVKREGFFPVSFITRRMPCKCCPAVLVKAFSSCYRLDKRCC